MGSAPAAAPASAVRVEVCATSCTSTDSPGTFARRGMKGMSGASSSSLTPQPDSAAEAANRVVTPSARVTALREARGIPGSDSTMPASCHGEARGPALEARSSCA